MILSELQRITLRSELGFYRSQDFKNVIMNINLREYKLLTNIAYDSCPGMNYRWQKSLAKKSNHFHIRTNIFK